MYNCCTMVGRIATDLELRHNSDGVAVTSFRIAVNRKYVRKGEERKTDYFNVVCWRDVAEFVCKHFDKGKLILIEGEMQQRQYTDKNGNSATVFELVAEHVSL